MFFCCCNSFPCSHCLNDKMPATVTAEASGIVDGTCTNSASINAAFVIGVPSEAYTLNVNCTSYTSGGFVSECGWLTDFVFDAPFCGGATNALRWNVVLHRYPHTSPTHWRFAASCRIIGGGSTSPGTMLWYKDVGLISAGEPDCVALLNAGMILDPWCTFAGLGPSAFGGYDISGSSIDLHS